jgi:hypothetical protein
MKRRIATLFVSFLLPMTFLSFEAHPAGIVNMVGTWTVKMSIVSVNGYSSSTSVMEITDQKGSRFRGFVMPSDPPNTNFYGVVDGDQVYITFWDSTVSGRFTNPGKVIKFVTQNQQNDPPASPSTSIGTMTRNEPGRN